MQWKAASLTMDKLSICAMNVSSIAASTHELKPFEAPFLSTDDPWFSWLKYFEDWLTATEVKPGVYEKSQNMFMSSQIYQGHKNHC